MQKSQQPAQQEKPEKQPDKPRVVLDTNVIVSQILLLFSLDAIQVCYSKEVLAEYEEIMSRPKFKERISREIILSVLEPLEENGLPHVVSAVSIFPMLDESDRVFYDVAESAEAFLITGNKKHYPDKSFVVTPREFMDLYQCIQK